MDQSKIVGLPLAAAQCDRAGHSRVPARFRGSSAASRTTSITTCRKARAAASRSIRRSTAAAPPPNTFLLDGAYDTDRNTFAIAVYPPMDSVQEFHIQSCLAPAEFPMSAGGAIDVVTKSGTRQFHGSAFEYLRNEATDARNYFDDPTLPRPIFRQNQFGASLGRPGSAAEEHVLLRRCTKASRGKAGGIALAIVPDADRARAAISRGRPDFRSAQPEQRTAHAVPRQSDPAGPHRPDRGQRILAQLRAAAQQQRREQQLPRRHAQRSSSTDSASGRIDHQFGNRGTLTGRYTLNSESNRVAGSVSRCCRSRSRCARSRPRSATPPARRTGERSAASRSRACGCSTCRRPRSRSTWRKQLGLGRSAYRPVQLRPALLQRQQLLAGHRLALAPAGAARQPVALLDSSRARARPAHLKFGGESAALPVELPAKQSLARPVQLHRRLHQRRRLRREQRRSVRRFPARLSAEHARAPKGRARLTCGRHVPAAYVQDDWRVSRASRSTSAFATNTPSPYTETRGNLLNLDYSTLPNAPRLVRGDRSGSSPTATISRRASAWPGSSPSGKPVVPRGLRHLLQSRDRGRELRPAAQRPAQREQSDAGRSRARADHAQRVSRKPPPPASPAISDSIPTRARPTCSSGTPASNTNCPAARCWNWRTSARRARKLGRYRQFNTPAHVETGENLPPRPGDLQALRTFPDARPHHPAAAHRELVLQLAAGESGEEPLDAPLRARRASSGRSRSTMPIASSPASSKAPARRTSATCGWSAASRFPIPAAASPPAMSTACPTPRFAGPVLRGWTLSGTVTLQDGTPVDPFYFALDFANSGTPNRPEHRPRAERDAAAQPAHGRPLLQYRRLHRAGAVHVRQRRTQHHPGPGQQHLRFRPAAAVPRARRPLDSLPRGELQRVQSPELGHSRDRIPISARSSARSSPRASRAACSSRCGTISSCRIPGRTVRPSCPARGCAGRPCTSTDPRADALRASDR